MERDKISFRQLMTLLWVALLAPAAELLPAVTAGTAGAAGWLSTLFAAPILLAAGWAVGRLTPPGGSLADGFLQTLGPAAGRGVLCLYLVWMESLLILRLRLSAQRLLGAGERDGGIWFFLAVLAGMALWMARGKLAALARAGELFFAILTVTAGAVVGLALLQVRGENLPPLWTQALRPALRSALPGAGVLGYGLFAAFLWGAVEEQRPGRRWLRWGVGGCAVLSAVQWVILGVFGPALTQRMDSPFFQLAKSVGVEGAFQRVESVVAALWVFSDLILLAGVLWAIRVLMSAIAPGVKPAAVTATALLPGAAAALAAFSGGAEAAALAGTLALAGNLTMGVCLPLSAAAVGAFRQTHKG